MINQFCSWCLFLFEHVSWNCLVISICRNDQVRWCLYAPGDLHLRKWQCRFLPYFVAYVVLSNPDTCSELASSNNMLGKAASRRSADKQSLADDKAKLKKSSFVADDIALHFLCYDVRKCPPDSPSYRWQQVLHLTEYKGAYTSYHCSWICASRSVLGKETILMRSEEAFWHCACPCCGHTWSRTYVYSPNFYKYGCRWTQAVSKKSRLSRELKLFHSNCWLLHCLLTVAVLWSCCVLLLTYVWLCMLSKTCKQNL